MDVSRMKQNISMDVITGDQLHRHHQPRLQRHQQLQDGHYYYTSTLTLRSSVVEDSGVYICSASNRRGHVERRTFLRVIPSGEPVPSALTISLLNFSPRVAYEFTVTAVMWLVLSWGVPLRTYNGFNARFSSGAIYILYSLFLYDAFFCYTILQNAD